LVQNKENLSHEDFIAEYSNNNDSIYFATNACISNLDGSPVGLFIANKEELNPLNLKDGNGNFYLKPNGVLSISKSDVQICESSISNKLPTPMYAVQSGPLLLNQGFIHPMFDINSKNRNIRCGVGIYSEKGKRYLLFVKSNAKVSFYEFATFFKEKFKCADALCLESSSCTIFTQEIGFLSQSGNTPIQNYIVYQKTTLGHSDSMNRTNRNVIQMIKTQGGTYDIPVQINGVLKINFILDSGASDVSISADVALTLLKTGTVSDNDFIGTQEYKFANGSVATSKVFLLNEIKIGGFIIKKVRASISNSIDAPMLLGQSVLQRLGKFTIDNSNHTLIIH
jgi:clan AA aspartic protease (TIGR02281 family)